MTSRAASVARRCAVAATAIGISVGLAGPAGAAQARENYPGGEATFKEECRMAGGKFERAVDGKVRCFFDSGFVIVCDRGARNCRSFDQNARLGTATRTYEGSSTAVAAR